MYLYAQRGIVDNMEALHDTRANRVLVEWLINTSTGGGAFKAYRMELLLRCEVEVHLLGWPSYESGPSEAA